MAALGPESELIMPCLPTAYKGPAVVMVIGGTFVVLGAVPVAITMALGYRSSATIIGMGFLGFGVLLLVLPGLCWCIVINHKRNNPWRRRSRHTTGQQEPEAAPALGDTGQSLCVDTEQENDEMTKTLPPTDTEADQINVIISRDVCENDVKTNADI